MVAFACIVPRIGKTRVCNYGVMVVNRGINHIKTNQVDNKFKRAFIFTDHDIPPLA